MAIVLASLNFPSGIKGILVLELGMSNIFCDVILEGLGWYPGLSVAVLLMTGHKIEKDDYLSQRPQSAQRK
jgi:hypothetical protein